MFFFFFKSPVQRQVQTLIERKDAYNMQVSQDWKTFRWSRIALLGDPAAKLNRMKVHLLSDSTLCVGISNPDLRNNWATKLDVVWNEHGSDEKWNLAAREVQFIGTCTLVLTRRTSRNI